MMVLDAILSMVILFFITYFFKVQDLITNEYLELLEAKFAEEKFWKSLYM